MSLFTEMIAINLTGAFSFMRHAAAAMAKLPPRSNAERGVIVNTASVAAYDGQKGQIAYATSKAGVVGMTLPAARDLGPLGIRVMTIAPGLFDTPILGPVGGHVGPLEDALVFPEVKGDPRDFALLVEQIVRNVMLNGEIIRLDGALRAPKG